MSVLRDTAKKQILAISIGLAGLSVMSANATLIAFDGIAEDNFNVIPQAYQPLLARDGITMTYTNVGLFHGGPDHTTGVSGGTNWHTFQRDGGGTAQIFQFSHPVQLPSMWLTNYSGATTEITITAYLAAGGVFSDTFTPTGHTGPGSFVWGEYTGLASVDVVALSLTSGSGINAQLDDLTVITVPEPTSAVLLGLGGLACGLLRRPSKH